MVAFITAIDYEGCAPSNSAQGVTPLDPYLLPGSQETQFLVRVQGRKPLRKMNPKKQNAVLRKCYAYGVNAKGI